MNEESQPVARTGAKNDGLAAAAILLLTVLLIALVITKIT